LRAIRWFIGIEPDRFADFGDCASVRKLLKKRYDMTADLFDVVAPLLNDHCRDPQAGDPTGGSS
jgi:hypothetical protein